MGQAGDCVIFRDFRDSAADGAFGSRSVQTLVGFERDHGEPPSTELSAAALMNRRQRHSRDRPACAEGRRPQTPPRASSSTPAHKPLRTRLRAPMISQTYLPLCATLQICSSQAGRDLQGRRRCCARRAGSLRASTRPKDGRNETAISPSETKRFAGHDVSHWNPYGRRIGHFAELFIFKGLTPFSFRRIHGVFVFNDLAPLFVSPFRRAS